MEPSDPSAPDQSSIPDAPVPHVWPGIFGVYKYSQAAVRFNLGTNIWLIVFGALLGGASQAGFKEGHNALAGVVATLLSTLCAAAMQRAQIASVRRTKISLENAFQEIVPVWLRYIALTLLLDITYVVSFLLLIVPFFIVMPRLALAPYFMVDRRMGVLEAYRTSWQVTKGHLLEPWQVVAGTILISLLALTIIGIPFTIYFYIMYSAALTVYYEMRVRAAEAAKQLA